MSGEGRLEVTVNIERRDYAAFYWYMMFRHRANLIKGALAAAGYIAAYLYFSGGEDWVFTAIVIGTSPILAALCVVLWTLLDMALIAVLARESKGQLGEMTYSIADDGVQISSSRVSVTHKWNAVTRVRASRSQLLVGIGGTCYLILPHRAFASDDERERFARRIKERAGQVEPLPAAKATERESLHPEA